MSRLATVEMLACDSCRRTPAVRYEIKSGDAPSWQIDLCTTCAKPIAELKSDAPRQPERKPRKRAKITVLPAQQ